MNSTTPFLLVRHAEHQADPATLAGRSLTSLTERGQSQAAALARHLAGAKIQRVLTSPLPRAHETARILASALGAEVEPRPALAEVDFGRWTGRRFTDLADEPNWRRWNTFRSAGQAPGGERMLDVQARVVAELMSVCVQSPGALTLVVSHADVIRAALVHFLGVSLDHLLRLEIAHASLSALSIGPCGALVTAMNHMVDIGDAVRAHEPAKRTS
ncbi:MAG: histidine phosphatase family protein [Myxococcales bacterium]|nr:histidine phosphatase family protein [Myxococcales bacterium]